MYILFNTLGQIIAKIPHGDVIRQNSTYHLYICFNKDDFDPESKFVTIKFKTQGKPVWGHEAYVDDYEYKEFKKISENEVLFGFIPNEKYLTYDFYVSAETYEEAMINFGIMEVSIVVYNKEDNDIYAKGIISYYVERTSGSNKNSLTLTQYQYLLKRLESVEISGGGDNTGSSDCCGISYKKLEDGSIVLLDSEQNILYPITKEGYVSDIDSLIPYVSSTEPETKKYIWFDDSIDSDASEELTEETTLYNFEDNEVQEDTTQDEEKTLFNFEEDTTQDEEETLFNFEDNTSSQEEITLYNFEEENSDNEETLFNFE
jgi:hypothetical protein